MSANRDKNLVCTSDKGSKFNETPTTFGDHITVDGSSGFKAEAGRYHLYVSFWSNAMNLVSGIHHVAVVTADIDHFIDFYGVRHK